MEDFKLGMLCMGNGTTLVNLAKEVNYDYETIGHISDHGVIDLYIPESEIPEEDMKSIHDCAARSKEKFLATWDDLNAFQKFDYMWNIPTVGCGYNPMQKIAMDNMNLPTARKVALMEPVFFETCM